MKENLVRIGDIKLGLAGMVTLGKTFGRKYKNLNQLKLLKKLKNNLKLS